MWYGAKGAISDTGHVNAVGHVWFKGRVIVMLNGVVVIMFCSQEWAGGSAGSIPSLCNLIFIMQINLSALDMLFSKLPMHWILFYYFSAPSTHSLRTRNKSPQSSISGVGPLAPVSPLKPLWLTCHIWNSASAHVWEVTVCVSRRDEGNFWYLRKYRIGFQGGPGIKKKDPGSNFFKMGSGRGLTRYVSGRLSIYG